MEEESKILEVEAGAFRQIVENSIAGVYLIQDGVFKYVNNTLTKVLGYEKEEIVGKNPLIFIHPDDRDMIAKNLKERFEGKGRAEPYEIRVLRKDGKTITADLLGGIIEVGGRPAAVGFVIDVTDRKWAETQMKQFSDIVANMGSGLYVYRLEAPGDPSSLRLINANPAATRGMGLERRDLIGKTIFENFPSLAGTDFAEKVAEVAFTGKPYKTDNFLYEDSKIRANWFSVRVYPLPDLCAFILFENITERKTEENRRKATEFLLDSAMDSVFVHDEQGKFFYVNDSAWKTRGYAKEELMAMNLHDLDAPEFAAMIPKRIKELDIVKGNIFESIHRKKDGSTIPVEIHAKFIEWEGKRLVSSVVRDISESKRSQAELENTLKIGKMGRAKWDLVNDTLLVWPSLRELLKLPEGNELDYSVNSIYEKIRDNDRIFFGERVEIATKTGSEDSFELTTVPIGGNEKMLKIYISPEKGANGKTATINFLIVDMTETVEEKKKIVQTSKELEFFFRNSLDLTCVANVEGKFLRLGKQWEKTLGYVLSDLEGCSYMELVHPDDVHSTLEAVSKLKNEEKIFNFTNRYRAKDGSYRWLEWRGTPNRGLIFSIARDITEQVERENQIEEGREKAESLIENARVIAVELDLEGNLVKVNRAFEEELGYSQKELAGTNWFEKIVPKARYPQVWEIFEKLPAGELPKEFENPVITKSGEEKNVIWRNSEIKVKGKIVGSISFGFVRGKKSG